GIYRLQEIAERGALELVQRSLVHHVSLPMLCSQACFSGRVFADRQDVKEKVMGCASRREAQ
ncbi:MAG: hypothetical protein COX66_01865, partial [Elusimicrobia bacterium CG_4_10_14_0_2_um_filter_63_34]